MIRALIGPIAELAGGWLKGKASAQAASANLKLVEAHNGAGNAEFVERRVPSNPV